MILSQTSIYIVDNDPDVRSSLQRLLESELRHVTAYESAHDFLTHFEPLHPCCLILELNLPGMTGQELLQRLRIRYVGIQVIVITAYADVPTILHAIHLGAVDVCQKPVDPQVLIPMVEHTLLADAAFYRQRQQIVSARQRLASLTPRERQLFGLLVEGKTYKEMAVSLGISPRTVEHHRAHITSKLGIDRVTDMVRLGLVAGDDDTPLASGAVAAGERPAPRTPATMAMAV